MKLRTTHKFLTGAVLLSAVVMLSGCNSGLAEMISNIDNNSAAAAPAVSTSASTYSDIDEYTDGSNSGVISPSLGMDKIVSMALEEGESSEPEERNNFQNIFDLFDYKKDKSEIAFMAIATEGGPEKMTPSNCKDQIKKYGIKAQIQSNGGLYAFDSAGAILSVKENSDGSKEFQLVDGGVLGAAAEGKYMQVLKSDSTCLGLHLGATSGFLELYMTDIKTTDSEYEGAVHYVLERDDYKFEAYTNAGYCFYYILTIY